MIRKQYVFDTLVYRDGFTVKGFADAGEYAEYEV
jgi:lipopolysaccharide biosynthesis protein